MMPPDHASHRVREAVFCTTPDPCFARRSTNRVSHLVILRLTSTIILILSCTFCTVYMTSTKAFSRITGRNISHQLPLSNGVSSNLFFILYDDRFPKRETLKVTDFGVVHSLRVYMT